MRDRDLDILHRILETRGGFGHREHVELTWSYLRVYDVAGAHRAVGSAIKHLAMQHGTPDKYHATITRSWVQLVALHWSDSKAESFDEFIADNPALLDRHLLDRHYSRDLISSPQARKRWIQPDLRKFPVGV